MSYETKRTTVFKCDECGKEQEMIGDGLSLLSRCPLGWFSVAYYAKWLEYSKEASPSITNFCSYECLLKFPWFGIELDKAIPEPKSAKD